MKLACIVEGHGEVAALPLLVQRILAAHAPTEPLDLLRPVHRVPRGKLVKGHELERAVQLQANRVGAAGAILVLVDAEDDCAATLGPRLQQHIAREDVRVGVVVAVRMYEAWLVGSAASLAGRRSLPADLQPPPDVEQLANPKTWLSPHMGHYSETVDQPALTGWLDVELAAALPSFRKLLRELSRLLLVDLGAEPRPRDVPA